MGAQRIVTFLGFATVILGGFNTGWPERAPQLVGSLIIFAGIVMLLFSVLGWISGVPVRWFTANHLVHSIGWPWVKRLIPLREGARFAYERTRASNASEFAEQGWGRSGKPDVLSWYALALIGADRNGVTVLGKKPPSTKLEVVPPHIFKSHSFSPDLNSIQLGKSNLVYSDLYVPVGEVKRRIKEIGSW